MDNKIYRFARVQITKRYGPTKFDGEPWMVEEKLIGRTQAVVKWPDHSEMLRRRRRRWGGNLAHFMHERILFH